MAKQKQRPASSAAPQGVAKPPRSSLVPALHALLDSAGLHHSAAAILDDGNQHPEKLEALLSSFITKHLIPSNVTAHNAAKPAPPQQLDPHLSDPLDSGPSSIPVDPHSSDDSGNSDDSDASAGYTRRKSGVVQKLANKLDTVSPERPSAATSRATRDEKPNAAAGPGSAAEGCPSADDRKEKKKKKKSKKEKKKKKEGKDGKESLQENGASADHADKFDEASADVEKTEQADVEMGDAKSGAALYGANGVGEANLDEGATDLQEKKSKKEKKKNKKKEKADKKDVDAPDADNVPKAGSDLNGKPEPKVTKEEPLTENPSVQVEMGQSKTPQSAGQERKRKRRESGGRQGSQERFKRVKEDVLYTRGDNPQRKHFRVHNDLIETPARGVKKEKMKKRISYSGGGVSHQVNSFQYEDSDSD